MALLPNLPIRLHVKNRHPFELQAPKASTVSAIRVPNDLKCFAIRPLSTPFSQLAVRAASSWSQTRILGSLSLLSPVTSCLVVKGLQLPVAPRSPDRALR